MRVQLALLIKPLLFIQVKEDVFRYRSRHRFPVDLTGNCSRALHPEENTRKRHGTITGTGMDGWDYGTAEAGNNGTHEMDVARWALQVDFPNRVDVDATKGQFLDDGWEMYDTMDAVFKFDGDKSIKWSGYSRNGFDIYKGGRGTIIYGSEGSVFVDRGRYMIYDRKGELIKEATSASSEAGMALGGGGNTTNMIPQTCI